MILYRPVGLQELELIYDSGMKAFPARLPQQPIFYPVLQLEYARQIASDWNAKSGQSAGYVTQFKVEEDYISKFEEHTVGSSQHRELWIPAEELEEFNKHIVGHIQVLEAHFGGSFQGFIPDQFGLQGKNAVEQFTLLANSYIYKQMDFYLEIKRNHKAVFLNYPFWQKHEFKNPGLKEKIIKAIREAWLTSFPKIPLVHPMQEDVRPAKQADLREFGDSVQDAAPVKQIDSDAQHSTKSVHKVNTPTKKTDSPAQRWVKPIDDDAPVEQIDSESLVKSVHADPTPVKPIDSDSWSNPGDEDISSEGEAGPDFFVEPVHQDTPLVQQTGAHFSRGLELGLSGQYHEAIDELSKAVEEDPDDITARTSLGVVFHRLGEDDRALSCYEAALKIEPDYAEAHYFRANILYSHGKVPEAMTGFTIAIGLKPELIDVHKEAAPQDRLTDYGPAPAEMYRVSRSAHRILGLNKSLAAHPEQASLFKERAAEYARLWNHEQASADYSSSLAIQPDDADAFHLRGVAYEQMGQPERAREDYKRALTVNPQLSDEYINRGVTFGQMGNLRQSIASFTEGIRLAPGNPNGYFNRGTAYFQQGDLEKAIEDFSNVIRLSPGDEAAYYWRGISNEEAGRQREAIDDYRQFLALSQDENARREIEQRLSQWNEGERSGVRDRSIAPNEGQKTNQEPDRNLDLYDLILALGERALHSTWFGSNVDCYGEKAQELYAFTGQNRAIDGRDFLRITSGIQQTTEGDFQAFDPGETSPWIFIRAWEGSEFYIETNDPQIERQLKRQFPSLEEVEGANPPYVGLFIRI